jgi:hypothetical protein
VGCRGQETAPAAPQRQERQFLSPFLEPRASLWGNTNVGLRGPAPPTSAAAVIGRQDSVAAGNRVQAGGMPACPAGAGRRRRRARQGACASSAARAAARGCVGHRPRESTSCVLSLRAAHGASKSLRTLVFSFAACHSVPAPQEGRPPLHQAVKLGHPLCAAAVSTHRPTWGVGGRPGRGQGLGETEDDSEYGTRQAESVFGDCVSVR